MSGPLRETHLIRAANCPQHIGGYETEHACKHCRNCGLSIAWLNEQNRMRGSTFTVPSLPCVEVSFHGSWRYECLTTQRLPWYSDEWIEVVW